MSNGPPKKTKARRLAKILGAVVLLVIGFLVFANIQDVNTKNSEEATPLHWAAAKNATETAQLLITQGAEICAKDTLGQTPLHWAARNNAAETTEVLLTQGANINEKDEYGNTPLHWAASNNAYAETAQLLITHGAGLNVNTNNSEERDTTAFCGSRKKCNQNSPTVTDPRSRDLRQRRHWATTPLHWAAWNNAAETAKALLITWGAKINTKKSEDMARHHCTGRRANNAVETAKACC